ncbi:hypothetical protein ACFXTH_013058 [Malus domestica]
MPGAGHRLSGWFDFISFTLPFSFVFSVVNMWFSFFVVCMSNPLLICERFVETDENVWSKFIEFVFNILFSSCNCWDKKFKVGTSFLSNCWPITWCLLPLQIIDGEIVLSLGMF